MIDPRLTDMDLDEHERTRLADLAGLLPADHPQLWKDSALSLAAMRAELAKAERDLDTIGPLGRRDQVEYIAAIRRSIERHKTAHPSR